MTRTQPASVWTTACAVTLAVTLAARPAAANQAPPPAVPPAEPPALPFVMPSTAPTGRGFAIGYDNGQFGDGFGQSLRLRLPIGLHWGLFVRALSVLDDRGRDDQGRDQFQWSIGGRLEVFGASPVFLNLVRLYGSGGPQVFRGMRGEESGVTSWGSGGQFGFEFFQSPRFSLFLEVGGQGGARQVAGATVMAGFHVYLSR